MKSAIGLSVAELAQLVGVAALTLYAWCRRLAAAMQRELPPQIVELTDAEASAPTAATGAIVVKLCADRRSLEVSFDLNGSRAAAARRSDDLCWRSQAAACFLSPA